METAALLDQLRARQQAAQITDSEMARRLGISQPLWWRITHGERRLTDRVLSGVMKAYPDLAADVLVHLRGD